MRISYKKLWIKLAEMEVSKVELRKTLCISTGTMTKLRRNEPVSLEILMKICDFCKCNIGDTMDFISDSE